MVRLVGFGALLALVLASCASAALVEFTWEATWVWANPTGTPRAVIGINNAWPCPMVRASVGDTVRVHLTNGLGNQTTGIHWHGINQISTNWADGPSMVTQCPIPPGSTFTYEFVADAPGTFWYHSHNLGQYPDGFRGVLIIDDPMDPFADEYDEEYIITASDWYDGDSITLVQQMLTPENFRGLPPFPNAALLNDGLSTDYPFDNTKVYRFRIISFAAFASFMIHFDSHPMTVIMNDAAYIDHENAYMLRLAPAQRYDVLIKGKPSNNRNYPFLFSLDQNRDWSKYDEAIPPLGWPLNATGYLVMEPDGERREDVVKKWRPDDDSHWEPFPATDILPPPDKIFEMDFAPCLDVHGIPRTCIDGSPYLNQRVPTLYTAATTGDANTDPVVYGQVHPFIANYGDIIDIVINNMDAAVHPFHLHGHHFQVLKRPRSDTGKWPGFERARLRANPPWRDTVAVMANSYAVLRFKADNPGVYLFHCHIEWHVEMGLTATIIEAPEMLRGLSIPQDHIDACSALGIPYEGNAGGSTDNYTDTSNMIFEPEEEYFGAQYFPPATTARVKRTTFSSREMAGAEEN